MSALMLDENRRRRRDDQQQLIKILERSGYLRPELDVETATDVY